MGLRVKNGDEISQSVRARRRQAYPSIGDQLDAIWAMFDSERAGGKALPAKADAMLDKIMAVKAANPKGGE